MNVVQAIMALAVFNILLAVGCNLSLFGSASQQQLASTENIEYKVGIYNASNFTQFSFNNILKALLGSSTFFSIGGLVLLILTGVPTALGVGLTLFLGFFVGLWTTLLGTLGRVAGMFSFIPYVPGIMIGIFSFTMLMMIMFVIVQVFTGGWRLHQ